MSNQQKEDAAEVDIKNIDENKILEEKNEDDESSKEKEVDDVEHFNLVFQQTYGEDQPDQPKSPRGSEKRN